MSKNLHRYLFYVKSCIEKGHEDSESSFPLRPQIATSLPNNKYKTNRKPYHNLIILIIQLVNFPV